MVSINENKINAKYAKKLFKREKGKGNIIRKQRKYTKKNLKKEVIIPKTAKYAKTKKVNRNTKYIYEQSGGGTFRTFLRSYKHTLNDFNNHVSRRKVNQEDMYQLLNKISGKTTSLLSGKTTGYDLTYSKDINRIPLNYSNYLLNSTDNEMIFRLLYSAADLLVIPSQLESFGQTIIEAGSCNTPSIGFKHTGAQEAIRHKETGYLADINNKKDFLDGIKWCFKEIKDKDNKLGLEARINVEKNFSNEFVSKKYVKLYEDFLTK